MSSREGPRLDIQGLRALAVVLVIANHLTGWPGGGFIGVDVFFVISGFLITGLLLREQRTHGRISLLGFYRRRARRILPAAVLTLAATALAAGWVFNAARVATIRGDAASALVFGANWRFVHQEVNYFNAGAPPSPVEHFWSLSIEEQFYFVWPGVLLVGFLLLARRTRPVMVGLVAFAVVGSFGWALAQTSYDAGSAYFETSCRIWELGVGALLALVAPRLQAVPDRLRPPLAWLGLLGIVAAAGVITSDRAFPAPWAAMPVLSTALLIAAGTRADSLQQRSLVPLVNPVAVRVGDWSYSLYLWHFPVIVVATARFGAGWPVRLTSLVVLAGAALASYHLVEAPLHHRAWTGPDRVPWARVGVAATALLIIGPAVMAAAPHHAERGFTVAVPAGLPPRQEALTHDIAQALAAPTWPPAVRSSISDAIGGPTADRDLLDCARTPQPDPAPCRSGAAGAAHTAVVVGDSIGLSMETALRQVFAQTPGWKLATLAVAGCPFADVSQYVADPTIRRGCPARRDEVRQEVARMRPDLLLVVNAFEPHLSGDRAPVTPTAFADAEARQVAATGVPAGRVVLIAAPPYGPDVSTCLTPFGVPADCVSPLSSSKWMSSLAAERTSARTHGWTFVDSRPWFCVQGLCPAFVGTTPVRVDEMHLSIAYAHRLVPVIREDFLRRGLLGG